MGFKLGRGKGFQAVNGEIKTKMRFGSQAGDPDASVPGTPIIRVPLEENWYLSVGQGMGSTLLIANQKNAYTLSDRSTWIAFNKKENLQIVCENLPPLFNQYGIILVSNKINNNLNIEEAKKYIDWITSEEAKKLINNYRVNGKQLFFFNHN